MDDILFDACVIIYLLVYCGTAHSSSYFVYAFKKCQHRITILFWLRTSNITHGFVGKQIFFGIFDLSIHVLNCIRPCVCVCGERWWARTVHICIADLHSKYEVRSIQLKREIKFIDLFSQTIQSQSIFMNRYDIEGGCHPNKLLLRTYSLKLFFSCILPETDDWANVQSTTVLNKKPLWRPQSKFNLASNLFRSAIEFSNTRSPNEFFITYLCFLLIINVAVILRNL